MSSPLLCPQGSCKKYNYECAGGHYCSLDKPFLCPDMSCKVNLRSCPGTLVGLVFDSLEVEYQYQIENIDKIITNLKRSNIEFNLFFDAFNAPQYSPFEGRPLNRKAKLKVVPVSLGELRLIQNVLNSTLAAVVKDFYMIAEEIIPSHITLRSTAFRITTEDRWDDAEYFKSPIAAKISINALRRHENPVSNLSV
jgi:hypothetical protein